MIELRDSYKIFIIDDSIFIRNTLMDLLYEIGFDVVGMASDAKTGFKYVAETRPDVVLLDISLPGIPTAEVIRGLLAINRNLEIIVLAPLSNLNLIARFLRHGARDFIPKPLVASQVEYVLKSYELSAGLVPQTNIQIIGELHSLFYGEMLKHAPANVYKTIELAIHKPLSRLAKKYKDRYHIEYNPIRINLLLAQKTHTGKIYKMYYNQLNRLYRSILNKLNKSFPKEYVFSLLAEAYQSYYQLAKYLLEKTEYSFPVWKEFSLEDHKPEVDKIDARFDYVYHTGTMLNFKETDADPHTILQPYKMVVDYDPRLAPKFPRPEDVNIDNLDIHIILSYFDDILGPHASLIIPPPHGRIEKDKLQSVPKFMDMIGTTPGEPFMHAIENYGSINMIFSAPMANVRGGTRDYMLSIIISPAEVREMVKITQMGAIMRAVSGIIINHYREIDAQGDLEGYNLTTEPQVILSEFLEEVKLFLKRSSL